MPRGTDAMAGLRKYVEKFDNEDSKAFLDILKFIASLALRTERLFKKTGIRILRKNTADLLYYTAEEIACVVAQGFF